MVRALTLLHILCLAGLLWRCCQINLRGISYPLQELRYQLGVGSVLKRLVSGALQWWSMALFLFALSWVKFKQQLLPSFSMIYTHDPLRSCNFVVGIWWLLWSHSVVSGGLSLAILILMNNQKLVPLTTLSWLTQVTGLGVTSCFNTSPGVGFISTQRFLTWLWHNTRIFVESFLNITTCSWGFFTPHTVRHPGPSYDAIHQLRSLPEIQQRGRWSCPGSVARYKRPGRLLLQASRLPPAFQNSGAFDFGFFTDRHF